MAQRPELHGIFGAITQEDRRKIPASGRRDGLHSVLKRASESRRSKQRCLDKRGTELAAQNGWSGGHCSNLGESTPGPFGSSFPGTEVENGIVHLWGAIATMGTNPVAFTLGSAPRLGELEPACASAEVPICAHPTAAAAGFSSARSVLGLGRQRGAHRRRGVLGYWRITGGMTMDRQAGTVTFLLTDIEGSTRLWEADPAGMRVTLAAHDQVTVYSEYFQPCAGWTRRRKLLPVQTTSFVGRDAEVRQVAALIGQHRGLVEAGHRRTIAANARPLEELLESGGGPVHELRLSLLPSGHHRGRAIMVA